MNDINIYAGSVFESIKYIDEFENEYWLARKLMNVFEYKKW